MLGVGRMSQRLFSRFLWVKLIEEKILGKAFENIFYSYVKIVMFDNLAVIPTSRRYKSEQCYTCIPDKSKDNCYLRFPIISVQKERKKLFMKTESAYLRRLRKGPAFITIISFRHLRVFSLRPSPPPFSPHHIYWFHHNP